MSTARLSCLTNCLRSQRASSLSSPCPCSPKTTDVLTFHRTSARNAASILRSGFRSGPHGVWLTAIEPLPPFRGLDDQAVVVVNVPVDTFERFRRRDTVAGDVACLPASTANQFGRWLQEP
jgi:hypothetical protein